MLFGERRDRHPLPSEALLAPGPTPVLPARLLGERSHLVIPPEAGASLSVRPVRLFSGEVLEDSLVPERLAYTDDLYPPHRTGSYAAYWNCISWIPVTKGGSCLCEHGPSTSFESDAEKAGAVVWLGR